MIEEPVGDLDVQERYAANKIPSARPSARDHSKKPRDTVNPQALREQTLARLRDSLVRLW